MQNNQKQYSKIKVIYTPNFVSEVDLIDIIFEPGWSAIDYREAAHDIYSYMNSVAPRRVYVIADFSNPHLSFRRDILGPVWVDSEILHISVDAPQNRGAVFFLFTDPTLLSVARFAASASNKFMTELLKPENISRHRVQVVQRISDLHHQS